MNRVTIINGMEGEGKTQELIMDFLGHVKDDKIMKHYFLTSLDHKIAVNHIEHMIEGMRKDNPDFAKNANMGVYTVNGFDDLKRIAKDVDDDSTVLYVDGTEFISNFDMERFLELVDEHQFDCYITRQRCKETRGSLKENSLSLGGSITFNYGDYGDIEPSKQTLLCCDDLGKLEQISTNKSIAAMLNTVFNVIDNYTVEVINIKIDDITLDFRLKDGEDEVHLTCSSDIIDDKVLLILPCSRVVDYVIFNTFDSDVNAMLNKTINLKYGSLNLKKILEAFLCKIDEEQLDDCKNRNAINIDAYINVSNLK